MSDETPIENEETSGTNDQSTNKEEQTRPKEEQPSGLDLDAPAESDKKPTKYKGRKALEYRAAECLNCGSPLELTDVYCSYCGQLNTKKSLALTDFIAEFVGSIITYDSRFRYTLRDLLFKPGVITRNYVGGQRLKYANPFRFFLSVSIIYFLLQGILTSITGTNTWFKDNSDQNNKEVNFGPNDNVKFFTKEDLDTLDLDSAIRTQSPELDALLKNKNIPGMSRVDSILKQQNTDLDSIMKSEDLPTFTELDSLNRRYNPFAPNDVKRDSIDYLSEAQLDTLNWTKRSFERFFLYRDFYKLSDIKDPRLAIDSLRHNQTTYNRWVYSKNESIDKIVDDPRGFATYLMNKIPFFVFFFAPIFALFFWLLYIRRKYTYMEHLVFIFHIFSFVFVGMLIALLPDTLLFGDGIIMGIFLLVIGPFYFYKALRNFYQQSRLKTILKFLLLNVFFWIGVNITALIFFAISAAVY